MLPLFKVTKNTMDNKTIDKTETFLKALFLIKTDIKRIVNTPNVSINSGKFTKINKLVIIFNYNYLKYFEQTSA